MQTNPDLWYCSEMPTVLLHVQETYVCSRPLPVQDLPCQHEIVASCSSLLLFRATLGLIQQKTYLLRMKEYVWLPPSPYHSSLEYFPSMRALLLRPMFQQSLQLAPQCLGKVVENILLFVHPSTLHQSPFVLVPPLEMVPSKLVPLLNSGVEE